MNPDQITKDDIIKEELEILLSSLEQHSFLNEEIAQAIEEHDDFTLAVEIGGDEATVSEWVARVRRILKLIK